MKKVLVFIISGSVGVGKTSVAEEISEILKSKSIPHAYVDLDNLSHAYPRPQKDPFHFTLGMKNLTAVWRNFKELGVKILIIPHVFEDRAELDDFHKAIPNAEIQVVGLRAKLETIHNRLKKRDTGSQLEWHLNRATVLAKQFDQNQVEDFIVNTDEKSAHEVAEDIISLSGLLKSLD